MNTPTTAAFTVNEVLQASWALTKKHWGKFLFLGVVIFGIQLGYGIIFAILDGVLGLPMIIDQCLSLLISAYVMIVSTRGGLAIIREQAWDFKTLLNVDGKLYLMTLGATLLFYIMTIVGFVLLIIPGIIVGVTFSYYIYSLVDRKTDAIPAFEDSMNMTKGSRMNIFLYSLVLGLLALVIMGIPGVVVLLAAFGLQAPGVIAGVLVGLYVIFAVVVTVIFGIMGMSGNVYMYEKMRVRVPVPAKK